MPKCEGIRRFGGAFTLGPVRWVRCEEEPIVVLSVLQDKATSPTDFLACKTCWEEALKTSGIKVLPARPIQGEHKDEHM
jgi:hypothetical protein